jgi:hypothetical protein
VENHEHGEKTTLRGEIFTRLDPNALRASKFAAENPPAALQRPTTITICLSSKSAPSMLEHLPSMSRSLCHIRDTSRKVRGTRGKW